MYGNNNVMGKWYTMKLFFLFIFFAELTNTTMSDDSSEEEEEEWEMELAKRQQQLQQQSQQPPPQQKDVGETRTVTRDTTSEYKRSGKNLSGAAAAAAAASPKKYSSDNIDSTNNVRPLPLPLASMSGDSKRRSGSSRPSRKPKRPVMTAEAAINAMNAAAEAAFSIRKAPPRPTMLPSEVTTKDKQIVSSKKGSLLDGTVPAGDDNYEDDYDESKEGEEESSEEYDDDDEDEDEDEDLSLEGEEDLGDKGKSSSTTTSSTKSTGKVKSIKNEVMFDDNEAFVGSSQESATSKYKDFYSNSYVNGDLSKDGLILNWSKDGQQVQPPLKQEEMSGPIQSPEENAGSYLDNVVGDGPVSTTTEKPEIECPLKCNRGSCTREPSTESGLEQSMTGYRCLCPMGTRGTFCEIGWYFL